MNLFIVQDGKEKFAVVAETPDAARVKVSENFWIDPENSRVFMVHGGILVLKEISDDSGW